MYIGRGAGALGTSSAHVAVDFPLTAENLSITPLAAALHVVDSTTSPRQLLSTLVSEDHLAEVDARGTMVMPVLVQGTVGVTECDSGQHHHLTAHAKKPLLSVQHPADLKLDIPAPELCSLRKELAADRGQLLAGQYRDVGSEQEPQVGVSLFAPVVDDAAVTQQLQLRIYRRWGSPIQHNLALLEPGCDGCQRNCSSLTPIGFTRNCRPNNIADFS